MVHVDVKRKGGPGGSAQVRVKQNDGCGYLLVRWLIAALTIWGVAWLLDPHVHVDGFKWALIVAAIVGLLNTFVRPIMIVLTLPMTVLTLGLFLFVINALLLLLTDWLIADAHFHIESFWWALLAAVLISIVNALVGGKKVRK
jgi:putative membrane protein